MVRKLLSHVGANGVAYVALFVGLGGSAVAATSALPANSVDTVQLRNRAVTGAKVALHTLTGANINQSRLGTVPNAGHLGGLTSSAFQRRIATGCPSGQAIQSVAAGGNATCQVTDTALMMGGSGTNTLSSTRFLAPSGLSIPAASATDVELGGPAVASTASGLYVEVSVPPGTGNSWDFRFEVNGQLPAGPTCVIPNVGETCFDRTNTLSLPPGAQVSLVAQATGSPSPTHVTFGWIDRP